VTAYLVTSAAKLDFKAVLKETKEMFGTAQRAAYKRLIADGVKMLAEEPGRGGSWDRGAVMPGLRAFHLEHAGGKSGSAAHMLYYAVEHLANGAQRVVILRLLHEGMEPRLHIARAGMPR
jgi:toxin ParE1/3/4